MISPQPLKVALAGNPNAGKTSLFNALTGLNQKVGNFPGVTVDKKTGKFSLENGRQVDLIDLPGTYSLYPKSMDERVVSDILLDMAHADYPDVIIVVADATNLKRNLLLFTEIHDLHIPVLLALNMMDEVKKQGTQINLETLSKELNVDVFPISARHDDGITALKTRLQKEVKVPETSFYAIPESLSKPIESVKKLVDVTNSYAALHVLHQADELHFVGPVERNQIAALRKQIDFDSNLVQVDETLKRYEGINEVLIESYKKIQSPEREQFSNKLDQVLTHKFFGLPIFFGVFFLMFQLIFPLAEYPMDWIDHGFGSLISFLSKYLPDAWYSDLLTNGIISGLGGILVFIPQIALLFTFIAIIEETGYMARVSFMLDRVNKKLGLNGRSVVPMVSSVACAVPAIMSARTIDNKKERLITIFVAPLISCSARLPVYLLLIDLVIPDERILGFFNLQGLVLFGFYFLGLFGSLFTALLLKILVKTREKSFFIMELPVYRIPRWKNVGQTIYGKVRTFVFEAGKVIMIVSVILWFLASFGQGDAYKQIQREYQDKFDNNYFGAGPEARKSFELELAKKKLEHSYAGKIGKFIEPGIEPLGFDWKIGISLITSFAAREVFNSTMATIYSVEDADKDRSVLIQRMKTDINPKTGKPLFTLASGLSLMIFYAFAMQCMSTLAVVRRETKSWKWPLMQMAYMSALAYVSSWIVYTLMN